MNTNSAKQYTPKTVTFRSHHETDVVMAGLELLKNQTENDLESERSKHAFADEELLAYYEVRLTRIAIAKANLLDIGIKAVA